MTAHEEIFTSDERPKPVRLLASIVTIERAKPLNPAHLDLVALANVIIRVEQGLHQLNKECGAREEPITDLRRRVTRLELESERSREAAKAICGHTEDGDYS